MNDVIRTNLAGHKRHVSTARENADCTPVLAVTDRGLLAQKAMRAVGLGIGIRRVIRSVALVGCLTPLVVAAGCGGDAGDQPPHAAEAGARAGEGAGGKAAAAGAPSSASAGSVAGASGSSVNGHLVPMKSVLPNASPVACGEVYCPAPANTVGDLLLHAIGLPAVPNAVACCLDVTTGVCGSAAASDAPCEGPPVMDTACPGIDLSALAALVGGLGKNAPNDKAGCCTNDACGINGVIFGRGCVENDEMRRILQGVPVVGPLIAVPAAATCESPIAKPVKQGLEDGGVVAPDTDAGAGH